MEAGVNTIIAGWLAGGWLVSWLCYCVLVRDVFDIVNTICKYEKELAGWWLVIWLCYCVLVRDLRLFKGVLVLHYSVFKAEASGQKGNGWPLHRVSKCLLHSTVQSGQPLPCCPLTSQPGSRVSLQQCVGPAAGLREPRRGVGRLLLVLRRVQRHGRPRALPGLCSFCQRPVA